MLGSRRTRLGIELLENRLVPAITVDTLNDTIGVMGSTSLRDAVIAINAGTDTEIIIPANINPYTLTITGRGENAAMTGDLDITRTGVPLLIRGTGATPADTVIDADTIDRVFQIVNSGTTVTFQNLTIRGGLALDDGASGLYSSGATVFSVAQGGGIYNGGGTLTLDNVVIEDNVAGRTNNFRKTGGIDGQDAQGGGIYSLAGALTFSGGTTTFTRNTARGGDAFNSSPFSAAGGEGAGGGLFINTHAGVLTLNAFVDIRNNEAAGGAGAEGGPGGNALGGGVLMNSGDLTVSGSALLGNMAIGGAGGTERSSNFVDGGQGGTAQGGGIYFGSGGLLTIQGASFTGNIAQGGHGGTPADPGQSGGNGGFAQGGAIYFTDGTLVLTSSTVQGNQVSGGNGGSGRTGGNTSGNGGHGGDAEGGGIYGLSGSLTIDASTIEANIASAGNGGRGDFGFSTGGDGGSARGAGIFFTGSTLIIRNGSSIGGLASEDGNRANAGDGGDGGKFANGGHGGNAEGGGLFASLDREGSSLTISDSFIVNNLLNEPHAPIQPSQPGPNPDGVGNGGDGGKAGRGGDGGDAEGAGMYLEFASNSTVTASTIGDNIAVAGQGGRGGDGSNSTPGTGGNGGNAEGGGIYLESAVLDIFSSSIVRNSANAGAGGDAGNFQGSSGGGLYLGGRGGDGSGGGIYAGNGSKLKVVNSTVSGNGVNNREVPLDQPAWGAGGDGGTGGNGGSGTGAGGNGGSAQGGGIYIGGEIPTGSELDLFNSTIAENTVLSGPGGLDSAGNASGTDGVARGGGVATGSLEVTDILNAVSTIIGDNTSDSGSGPVNDDVFGDFTTAQNNLVEEGSGTNIGSFPISDGNIVGLDPKLDPLGFYGATGPGKLVHRLQPDSPALDTGVNPLGLDFDQRGSPFLRTSGGGTDIGAFEVQVAPATDYVAVFRNGTWFLDLVQADYNAATTRQFNFGTGTDIPIHGDWFGTGTELVGVFRPSTGQFFLSKTNTSWVDGPDDTANHLVFSFGANGDIPIIGKWLGGTVDYVGVFRPSTGQFFLSKTNTSWVAGPDDSANHLVFSWGTNGDVPVAGDWNGDGTTDVGVFRGGTWFLDQGNVSYPASGNPIIAPFNFGKAGDKPVVGKWLGGSVDYVGVFRPETTQWFLNTVQAAFNESSTIKILFGLPTDVPEVGRWLGDGVTYIGVYRETLGPSDGLWGVPGSAVGFTGGSSGGLPSRWILNKVHADYNAATVFDFGFGFSGDVPLVGPWQ
ncbi:MAG: hypothetical protein K2R98_07605 [Gemmataceae bacterium]|nr:hypothetical protein [Gemmataceae bacterium]